MWCTREGVVTKNRQNKSTSYNSMPVTTWRAFSASLCAHIVQFQQMKLTVVRFVNVHKKSIGVCLFFFLTNYTYRRQYPAKTSNSHTTTFGENYPESQAHLNSLSQKVDRSDTLQRRRIADSQLTVHYYVNGLSVNHVHRVYRAG